MVSLKQTDVLVVGAGPAGCAAAIHMRRQGLSVAVLDKAAFPRHKVCGDFLTPGAVGALRDLAGAELEAAGPVQLSGMRITYEGRDVVAAYPGSAHGWSLARRDLDSCLARAAASAGAQLHHGVRVTRTSRQKDGSLSLEAMSFDGEPQHWSARLVVDAGGRFSPLAGAARWRRPDAGLRRYAIWSHMEGMRGLGPGGEMHVLDGAYVGVAPLREPGTANVTMVMAPWRWEAARRDPRGYAAALLRAHPELAGRLRGARVTTPVKALGPLACRAATMGRDGLALVGDAGGFIDPFTGEGIFVAVSSAALLAECVAACGLESPEALQQYNRRFRAAFSSKFRLCRLLQVAIGHPWLARRVARALSARRDLADRLVAATGDLNPAGSVLSAGYIAALARACVMPAPESSVASPGEVRR